MSIALSLTPEQREILIHTHRRTANGRVIVSQIEHPTIL
jgi:hypothetical protein